MSLRSTDRQRVALVTGSSQGLGAEVCRMLAQRDCIVVATHRRLSHQAPQPTDTGLRLHHVEMDVTNDEQVRDIVSWALSEFGSIDILVNNAGVYLDREESPGPEFLPLPLLQTTLDVNLLGAVRTMAAVIPVMLERRSGVIVNVSSGMGRNVELAEDALYYRTSKSALTALTRCAAQRLRGHGIVVNAVCPGWVRTRMGGEHAVRSIEKGAEGIVAAALEPRKNGVLLRDSEDFGW